MKAKKETPVKDENMEIGFWGMKFKATNPSKWTVLLLLMLLIFFTLLKML